MTVFDLRAWADAHRYRWTLEESFAAETDPAERADVSWFVEVLCHRGKLYAIGQDTVGAWTATRGVLGELLAVDPLVRVRQRGDGEAVVAFPSRLLGAVSRVLKPRQKRPAPSTEVIARGLEALREHRAAAVRGREERLGRDGGAADVLWAGPVPVGAVSLAATS